RLSPAFARDWIEPALGMGPEKWNYGPVLHILTLPFALASSQVAAMRLVLFVDYALVAVTFVIWIRLLMPGSTVLVPAMAVLCVWLNYFPLLEAITGREVEILELFLVPLGRWALRRQRE